MARDVATEPPPTGEQLLAARVRLPEHVSYRSFDSETVVLNLATGKYHSLNPTGGQLLEALDQEGCLAQALPRLEALAPGRDPGLVREEALRFCRDLFITGLLEIVDEPR